MKKFATTGLLVALLVGGFAALGAPAASALPGVDPGVHIWQDNTGWHVRVTHNRLHDRVFSGEIVTQGELVDVHAVRLEPNDILRVRAQKHAVLFRFNNYGGVDGVDFKVEDAPSLGFGFLTDGHVLPTRYIAIGSEGTHPAHDPFVITL